MRLAYFSPLPPQPTGIADYSDNLLPHLVRMADITLFGEQDSTLKIASSIDIPVRTIKSFMGARKECFDMCVYQMGNNVAYHADIYRTLRRYPGITVLHDLNVHAFHEDFAHSRGCLNSYIREMGYAYGQSGVHIGRQALHKGAERYNPKYPLFERIGHVSVGVIAHSHFAQQAIASRCPSTPVAHIHQPIPVSGHSRQERMNIQMTAKAQLGLQTEDVLLASFGYMAPVKRIEVVLRSIAMLRDKFPNICYALIGHVMDGYDIVKLASKLGLDDIIRFTGFADPETFQRYLAATDIGINLRYPTVGETSASLLDLMAAAKPTLVTQIDAFVEIPDDICLKIDIENEQNEVNSALTLLLENLTLRTEIGNKARDYIIQTCAPEKTAAHYIRFIEEVIYG